MLDFPRLSRVTLIFVVGLHGLVMWSVMAGQVAVAPPEPLTALSATLILPEPLPQVQSRPAPMLPASRHAPRPPSAVPVRVTPETVPPPMARPAPQPEPPVLAQPEPVPPVSPVSAPVVPAALVPDVPPVPVSHPVPQPTPAPVSPPRFDADYLDNPAPAYPVLSRRMGEQGRVLLRVHVEPDGRASQVEVRTSSGFERLDRAALNTVRQWRFQPARQGNVQVAAWVLVPISFSLRS